MNYSEKLKVMQGWVYDNIDDVETLCIYLDIPFEDVVKCFPDHLVAAYNKTFISDTESYDEDKQAPDLFDIFEGDF